MTAPTGRRVGGGRSHWAGWCVKVISTPGRGALVEDKVADNDQIVRAA